MCTGILGGKNCRKEPSNNPSLITALPTLHCNQQLAFVNVNYVNSTSLLTTRIMVCCSRCEEANWRTDSSSLHRYTFELKKQKPLSHWHSSSLHALNSSAQREWVLFVEWNTGQKWRKYSTSPTGRFGFLKASLWLLVLFHSLKHQRLEPTPSWWFSECFRFLLLFTRSTWP